MTKVGRLAKRRKTEGGTEPGQTMLLGLLASAPVVVIFVVRVLAHPGELPWESGSVWWPLFLVGTPLFAGGALARFYTAARSSRDHAAARFGRALGFANGAIWILYAGLYAFFVLRPSA